MEEKNRQTPLRMTTRCVGRIAEFVGVNYCVVRGVLYGWGGEKWLVARQFDAILVVILSGVARCLPFPRCLWARDGVEGSLFA
jgi:hypothetical protein